MTATTHKALRGPRGGLVLCDEEFAKDIDKAVFPNAQGGALFNQIAAKAVAFKEASTPEYRDYAAQIVANAKAMAEALMAAGLRVVSGGTDNHLMLTDLRSIDPELTGRDASPILNSVGITLNRNSIPFDPRPPFVTSGLRIGLPAATTQGLRQSESAEVGELIVRALRGREDDDELAAVRARVSELARQFPPYPADFPGHV